ncbi:pilus assembly protein [Sinimarinibacterium thermocellulolyticum]|uniref:PilC/PilY family type IV pilus protein n=1 Tax=Sinimarinibacterium thermocellulolyticum TaxID=3170016 RepID=A0ABV2A7X5_9GAMM
MSAHRSPSPYRRLGFSLLAAALLGAATAQAAVTIDQSPLTVRNPLPPNVTLILDDSGSMQWTVMPDDPPGNDGRDTELINANINGVYYHPDVRYLPPYTATARPNAAVPTTTRYPNASFTEAWYDGFDPDGSDRINIATYQPGNSFADGPNAIGNATPRFSHTFRIDVAPRYEFANHTGCPPGTSGPNAQGQCTAGSASLDEPPYCQGHDNYSTSADRCNQVRARPDPCSSIVAPGAPGAANSPGLSLSGDQCLASGRPSEAPRCQGYGGYDSARDRCNQQQFRPDACGDTPAPGGSGRVNSAGLTLQNDRCRNPSVPPNCPNGFEFALDAGPSGEDCRRLIDSGGSRHRGFFVYIEPSTGQRHYVGVSGNPSTAAGSSAAPIAGTCAELTGNPSSNLTTGETYNSGFPAARCHSTNDDSGLRDPEGNVITVGQNVANWFSYYRKRLYMAKTGLMNALANLEPSVRFGFASINGGYRSSNPNPNHLPADRVSGSINTRPAIARVKPFGDGSASTQRAAFWNWLARAVADGGTPLQSALKAVGDYYKDEAQPWQSGSAENPNNPSQQLSCRQSYAILTTDGYWNGTIPTVGNVDGPENRAVVRIDGPNGQCFEYPRKSSSSSVCDAPVSPKPFVDGASNTLADVAMQYWLTDLRPGLPNNVPASNSDPAFWQHMSTFTVGLFGRDDSLPNVTPNGTTAQDVALWASVGGAPNNFAWPTPAADSVNNIADLVHAGINGRGGFFSAGSPEQFENGIRTAIQRISERVGTGASLAANSTRLDTGTTTFQSMYFSGKWTGDLKAFAVDPASGAISSSPMWTASSRLPAASARNIRTYNPAGASASARFPALTSPTVLSAAQQSALGANATERQAVIDYLRGDTSLERRNGGTFRDRDTALGDIVSSQPVFVGAPDPNLFRDRSFPGSASYASFAAAQSTRAPRIWVAANDGMVHAFHAANSGNNPAPGEETFAFLPDAVIRAGIKALTDPSYGSVSQPHQFFNDGELTVADAYLNGAWRTVLVGTTGRGSAKAVYALDITDPAAPALLWERSATDGLSGSDWIGQNTGKPVIALVGTASAPSWAVLVGNGYNSAQNKAALLQFDLGTGALSVYPTDASTNNGLAQAAVWIDDPTNGIGTRAYAGDLRGRVWKFDLTNAASTATLIYTATTAGGAAQPITGGMLVGRDPATANLWLFFGTGRYLTQGDLSDTTVQTWYGIIVDGAGSDFGDAAGSGRGTLRQRQILSETAPNADSNPPRLGGRTISSGTSGDLSGRQGWYIDLLVQGGTAQGERMVTPNQFQGSLLLGTTRIPVSSDPCNPSGSGWIMAVDPFDGTAPDANFFDLNGDGQFNDGDRVNDQIAAGVGFTSVPNNPIFVGNTMLVSFDNATTSSIRTAGTVGALRRISWREWVNP